MSEVIIIKSGPESSINLWKSFCANFVLVLKLSLIVPASLAMFRGIYVFRNPEESFFAPLNGPATAFVIVLVLLIAGPLFYRCYRDAYLWYAFGEEGVQRIWKGLKRGRVVPYAAIRRIIVYKTHFGIQYIDKNASFTPELPRSLEFGRTDAETIETVRDWLKRFVPNLPTEVRRNDF